MAKRILKGIGYTFATAIALGILYSVLFAIGPKGKCIVCTTKTITDTVISITEGGTKDVVFHLKQHQSYYINRGLENGLDLDSLRTKVLDRVVTISYASPTPHINQLQYGTEVIYSELR